MRLSSLVLSMLLALVFAGDAAAAQSKPAKAPKATATPSAPINLNSATAAQLETLPGVGARTAQLIIEHRQKNGGFKKIEELMTIKGIGEKSFLKLKQFVVIEGEKSGRQ